MHFDLALGPFEAACITGGPRLQVLINAVTGYVRSEFSTSGNSTNQALTARCFSRHRVYEQ